MYDQSFGRKTLEHVLWKRDFCNIPTAARKIFRETILTNATTSVVTQFDVPNNPLICFQLQGKHVYRLIKQHDELVVRKLLRNLKYCVARTGKGRSQIVTNLSLLLAEGVPYRVYRLDVRSFYESFQKSEVLKALYELKYLSPLSKTLIKTLLDSHTSIGGLGIPRGLSLSATLSDLLMKKFDHQIHSEDDTFYYSRYVDDIIIVTSAREKTSEFINRVRSSLPTGLSLNPDKKTIVEAQNKITKINGTSTSPLFTFDYLGYAFSVSDPTTSMVGNKKNGELNRIVSVDISRRKRKKLKTRIVRTFLDFSRNGNWELIRDRIAFLTQNFSLYDSKTGGKKLAGIYHSYPLVTANSDGLLELDRFLRNAVLANSGRVFSRSALLLNGNQKRQLLRYSFFQGHSKQIFVHFSNQRISEIQRCWVY